MIKVKFYEGDFSYRKINVTGHAYYDKYGKDVVCASVSTLTQGLINGMLYVLNDEGNFYTINSDKITIYFPKCDESDMTKIKLLIDIYRVNIEILEYQYPKHIKIEDEEVNSNDTI